MARSPTEACAPISKFQGTAILTLGKIWTWAAIRAPKACSSIRRQPHSGRGLQANKGWASAQSSRAERAAADHFRAARLAAMSSAGLFAGEGLGSLVSGAIAVAMQ